jgi:hypothetical protein
MRIWLTSRFIPNGSMVGTPNMLLSGQIGMQATINTDQNRLASGITWWEQCGLDPADTLRSIFLLHAQYSCWNPDDPNRVKMFSAPDDDPERVVALALADRALAGELPDITNQAEPYYNPEAAPVPSWAASLTPVAQIDPQLYFQTVQWEAA